MNKIFKTKYNYLTKNSVVTSELAKNKGKSGLVKTALVIAALSASHFSTAVTIYNNEFVGDLHKNADGTLTYSGSGNGRSLYKIDKLEITGATPNTASLGLNLDSIGYDFGDEFGLGLGLNLNQDKYAREFYNRRIQLFLDKADSIKAIGENSVAVKVLDEFKKDKHDPTFFALSNEEKADKIKELYKNLYTDIGIENHGTISSEKGNAIDFSAFNRTDLFGKAVENLNLHVRSLVVDNYGVISAPEDKAAFIGSDYYDRLELHNYSKIEGNIYLGKGNDDLVLDKGADIS